MECLMECLMNVEWSARLDVSPAQFPGKIMPYRGGAVPGHKDESSSRDDDARLSQPCGDRADRAAIVRSRPSQPRRSSGDRPDRATTALTESKGPPPAAARIS